MKYHFVIITDEGDMSGSNKDKFGGYNSMQLARWAAADHAQTHYMKVDGEYVVILLPAEPNSSLLDWLTKAGFKLC